MSESLLTQQQDHEEIREIVAEIVPVIKEAGEIALSIQGRVPKVMRKPDRSPVTDADLAVEEFLYRELGILFPDDGFRGEEKMYRPSKSGRRFIVDPIDGTVQFIHGQEFWANLLGYEDDRGGLAGLINFPARDELIYASLGSGCWEESKDGLRQLKVSGVSDIEHSYLLHNGIEFARQAKRAGRLAMLMNAVDAERGYADAFGHMEVIRGRADGMIDFLTEHHDIAPIRVAVSEAGGTWTALDGSQTLGTQAPGSITSNGVLHDKIRAAVAIEDDEDK